MTPELASRILILLSVVYGITIGALGMADSGAVSTFASIGGMMLGFLWFARWMVAKRG
jgi:membrane associated rhomboid family serine protease